MKRDERKNVFFFKKKKSQAQKKTPDEFAQNVPESSESHRVFNFLHDSNSIFRAGGIISEGFSGRTAWPEL